MISIGYEILYGLVCGFDILTPALNVASGYKLVASIYSFVAKIINTTSSYHPYVG